MTTSDRQFGFRDVVLIADELELLSSDKNIHIRRDLEMTDAETFQALISEITGLGLKVHHYTGPDVLAEHAQAHKDDVVFTIYGGQNSRNRMALVPAICETFGLKFVGPDVYGRVIAQDKEISKRLASDCGLTTPPWQVVRDEAQLSRVIGMSLPVVVKPIMEGSSIGITQRNRATRLSEVVTLVRELLDTFQQPVLVEEFIVGREVAFCKIENAGNQAWTFSEVVIEGDPTFFENRLFDAHEKQFRSRGRTVQNIETELDDFDRSRIEEFLACFAGYGFCRVDGRLSKGKFHFLELTPDAWIDQRGQFARSFINNGWSYAEIIAAVLASAD
jgi:D-alanine-D-alanine ligase